jgi:hypothetical protein
MTLSSCATLPPTTREHTCIVETTLLPAHPRLLKHRRRLPYDCVTAASHPSFRCNYSVFVGVGSESKAGSNAVRRGDGGLERTLEGRGVG